MRLSEITQAHIRQGPPNLVFGNLFPQRGDKPEVTLNKINACLARLDSAQKSCIIIDEAGIPRRVWKAKLTALADTADQAFVAAVEAKIIRVISVYALAAATATTLTFKSKPAGGSAAISAPLANGANGGEVLPRDIDGHFETVVGEALVVTTVGAAVTGIGVKYILVPNYAVDENGLVLFDENGNPIIAD